MFKEYFSITKRFHQDTLRHQENMEQHYKDMNSSLRNMENLASEMNVTLDRFLEEEEFPMLLSCDKEETLNDVRLMSVKVNEHAMEEHFAIDGLTPCMYEYWSDHEELKGELEERSKTFCTTNTFVLDDLEMMDSFVFEVPDKLPFLNKAMYVSLPNARGESIILGCSLLEGIT
ncbi:hypothetical protein Sjap_008277 [Stephania japonica]|uniref:Uncharacterized protein n=1 Tax=Stephania japonica TaxID=461633 RepID=A0AAP0JP69_9MAGN